MDPHPENMPGLDRVRALPITFEDQQAARDAYERLVMSFEERTGVAGIHWDELSTLEHEYWVRVHMLMRGD